MSLSRSALFLMLIAAAALPAGDALAKKKKRRAGSHNISKSIVKPQTKAQPAEEAPAKAAPAETMPGVDTASPADADTTPAASGGTATSVPVTAAPAAAQAAAGEQTRPPPPRLDAAGNVFKVTGDAAVDAAYEVCEKLFAGRTLEFDYLPPIRKGNCGTDRPVLVRAFGKQKVRMAPPATMNCAMLAKLDDWFQGSVQPLARKHLRSPVARIENATSYDCRNRYGDPKEKLSEHAKANALDMAGFITLSGLRVSVAADWGPNLRDLLALAKAAKEAREKAEAEAAAKLAAAVAAAKAEKDKADAEAAAQSAAAASAAPSDTASPAAVAIAVPETQPPDKKSPVKAAATAEPAKAGRKLSKRAKQLAKVDADNAKVMVEKKLLGKAALGKQPLDEPTRAVVVEAVLQAKQEIREDAAKTPHKRGQRRTAEMVTEARTMGVRVPPPATSRSRFLHAVHEQACKYFGTVLGPEANSAHADHFHVDLTPRNGSGYCQ